MVTMVKKVMFISDSTNFFLTTSRPEKIRDNTILGIDGSVLRY